MRSPILAGQRFGRLVVIAPAPRDPSGAAKWLCKCDCGGTIATQASMLKAGRTKGCGCLRRERAKMGVSARTHGEGAHGKTTPEYEVWKGMKARCHYPNHVGFHRYGGRGIRVCDRWRDSYAAFLADMGRRPSPKHSIDRIDNDGPYSPDNCRWATSAEQIRDRDFAELARKGQAAKRANTTPEQMAARIRSMNAARLAKQTPEQRRAIAAHARAVRLARLRSGRA